MSRLFDSRPGDDGLPGPARRLAVLALVLGTLMAVVDTTMVNIALPSIATGLEVSASRAVWVTNLFQISCAAFLLVFAALSELVSRRRLYVAGVGVFTLASLGSALSTSLESLLVFRALQGLGAAATLSIGPSLYRSIFPSRLLGSALGLSAMVVAAGYATGPAIGGLVLSVADWPWLFALHLPLGVIAVVLAWRALPREAGRRGGFDMAGALLSVAMLGGFFMAMDGVGHQAPAWQVVAWLALSIAAAWGFLRRQRRATHPLLPLDIFAEPRFSLALAAQGTAFVGQGLAFVALSFLFQQEMGFSPLETAWLFTPWPLAIMLVGPRAGRLADRVNPSLLASTGLALLLAGLVSLAWLDAGAGVVDVLWRMLLCGVGFGLFQPPNNRELMSTVPRERSASASGAMSTSRTVGQSLGVALVGAFLAAGAPVQATLWVGGAACLVALSASLARTPLAGAAQARRRRAAESSSASD
ncbi:DHA2 family multidrug resistance protein-like MFS transporter [Halomonas campaniensis]|uniref:DHA2 family multidrug resistance protein-like MFS transporter n=1 Tax=Halomonas campaniensis TaxID=213554 RepID=A0A7W5K4W9_9GAMM|nr:MFS transporter [Halomonas campaniensis]MBB3331992.1 DHA2 family multidrug resistance protein-like MFS transporter [Halomonas campaniensis]